MITYIEPGADLEEGPRVASLLANTPRATLPLRDQRRFFVAVAPRDETTIDRRMLDALGASIFDM